MEHDDGDSRPLDQRWEEDGFVVLRQFFSGAELRAIQDHVQSSCEKAQACWDPAVATPGGSGESAGMLMAEQRIMFEVPQPDDSGAAPPVRAMFGLHDQDAYYHSLLRHPRLLAVASTLFGGQQPVAEAVQYIDKPPQATYQFPYHQDNAYGQFWEPPSEFATGALALDSQTASSGAIVCLKGSHRLPVLPHIASSCLGASLAMEAAPDLTQFPEVVLELRPGDLSFHNTNTIHRTGANATSTSRRNLGLMYRSAHAMMNEHAREEAAYPRIYEQRTSTLATAAAEEEGAADTRTGGAALPMGLAPWKGFGNVGGNKPRL
eukprot:COSAG05_NODE_824_length_7108_cov_616.375375_3_plen_320_part_00